MSRRTKVTIEDDYDDLTIPRKRSRENNRQGTRTVKEKFLEDQPINLAPLTPLNEKQAEYIRLIQSKPLVLATGLAGSSKCVSCDTLIPTPEGIFEIKDFMDCEDGYFPLEKTVYGINGEERTSHFFKESNAHTLKLKTKFGYEIVGTGEHPILVVKSDGTSEFKCLDQIQVGDTVYLKHGKTFDNKNDFRYEVSPVEEYSEIPEEILKSGLSTKTSFLNSLFGIQNKIVSKHEKLLKQCQILLLESSTISNRYYDEEHAEWVLEVVGNAKITSPEYFFNKVESVTDAGYQTVYDFTVPGTHSFVSNGFVSHNTYIPTVMACDALLLGAARGGIDKIVLSRPNISNSKSLGYMKGDLLEKYSYWLAPVLSIMKERLGTERLNLHLEKGNIEFVPMEVIKGYSASNCFFLVDEAEDLSWEEAIKVVTRQGKNCTMVLAGDVAQSELKASSGMLKLIELSKRNPQLDVGLVDFNEFSDIVRSKSAREWIKVLVKENELK